MTLEESFHLSFPYVFYDQLSKNYYMIPESHRSKSIRLYKTDATTFPFGWTLNKELLTGNFYQDTGIIHHNNIWYLFTTTTIQPKDWRMELSGQYNGCIGLSLIVFLIKSGPRGLSKFFFLIVLQFHILP